MCYSDKGSVEIAHPEEMAKQESHLQGENGRSRTSGRPAHAVKEERFGRDLAEPTDDRDELFKEDCASSRLAQELLCKHELALDPVEPREDFKHSRDRRKKVNGGTCTHLSSELVRWSSRTLVCRILSLISDRKR